MKRIVFLAVLAVLVFSVADLFAQVLSVNAEPELLKGQTFKKVIFPGAEWDHETLWLRSLGSYYEQVNDIEEFPSYGFMYESGWGPSGVRDIRDLVTNDLDDAVPGEEFFERASYVPMPANDEQRSRMLYSNWKVLGVEVLSILRATDQRLAVLGGNAENGPPVFAKIDIAMALHLEDAGVILVMLTPSGWTSLHHPSTYTDWSLFVAKGNPYPKIRKPTHNFP